MTQAGAVKAFEHARAQALRAAGPDRDGVIEEGPRNQSLVDVTLPVTPGLQYKLKELEWSGNHEFPTAELQKMVLLPVGQPANTVRLSDQLQGVQKQYGTRGFITATIKAKPRLCRE